MRTFIFAFVLLLLLSFNTTAQSSFSLEGGLNRSQIKYVDSDFNDPESRLGFFLGVRHEISLSEQLSFNYILQYSQEGYRTNHFRDRQLHIPLDVVNYRYQYFRLIPHIEFRPYPMIGFFAGPNVGLAFKEDVKLDEDPRFEIGNDKFIENLDVGATIGARYYLKRLTFSASYYHGFSKHSNFQSDEFYERNRSFQFGVGYAFLTS